MQAGEHYIMLADLFRYPGEDAVEETIACQQMLDAMYPEAGKSLKSFTDYISGIDEDAREELFTKTFDVQPICYLDLGYVIFGEDYKRGTFLMHMQEEQKNLGRDCSPELPDHLYHVLHLITIHPDKNFVNELVAKILVPGIKKMIAEFESARVELKIKVLKKLHNAVIQEEMNSGNVYRNAFEALLQVLEEDFADALTEHNQVAELPATESFFARNNTVTQNVNQLVNNYKID